MTAKKQHLVLCRVLPMLAIAVLVTLLAGCTSSKPVSAEAQLPPEAL